MASVTIDIDLPDGITFTSYQRLGEAHGFEVDWAWPERCCCQRCRHEEKARWELTGKVRVLRDLDVWGQPSFWAYPAAFHRCGRCHHRQDLIPPFKRKDASYTYRFEQHVVRLMIGSTEEEVARRLGISAETVARIVKQQLSAAKVVDPQRVLTDVGLDAISLKKRHKLYVTILTDLTRAEQPQVLAVMPGRDAEAATKCLACLTPAQRAQVRSYRLDMGPAYHGVCARLLPNAKGVIDRFHVAKLWNDAIDGERKKNHAAVQGEAEPCAAEGVSFANVAVSSGPPGSDGDGPSEAGNAVHANTATANAPRTAGALQDDFCHPEQASSVVSPDATVLGRHGYVSGSGQSGVHV